jgi:hypothetical protein
VIAAVIWFALPAAASGRLVADVELPTGKSKSTRLFSGNGEVSIVTLRGFSFFAYYSGPGRTTRDGVSGRIGGFGRVALSFDADGKAERISPPGGCAGPDQLIWLGTYSGTVDFKGDPGLRGFHLRKRELSGAMEKLPHWNCGPEKPTPPPRIDPDDPGVEVDVAGCEAGAEVDFSGSGLRRAIFPDEFGGTVQYNVSLTRAVGRATVIYSLFATGKPSTFVFDDGLTEGTLTPPPPFQGTGRLVRPPGGDWEWTGSLDVTFPGHRVVALVEPGFEPRVSTFRPRSGQITVSARTPLEQCRG